MPWYLFFSCQSRSVFWNFFVFFRSQVVCFVHCCWCCSLMKTFVFYRQCWKTRILQIIFIITAFAYIFFVSPLPERTSVTLWQAKSKICFFFVLTTYMPRNYNRFYFMQTALCFFFFFFVVFCDLLRTFEHWVTKLVCCLQLWSGVDLWKKNTTSFFNNSGLLFGKTGATDTVIRKCLTLFHKPPVHNASCYGKVCRGP